MSNSNKVPDFNGIYMKIVSEAPRKASVAAKNFFKDSFVKGGWTDEAFKAWPPGVSPLARKLMYNKGDLMNSIRSIQESNTRVEVGTHINYAHLHNDGGTITVTARMKKFWWAKYYELAGKKTKKNGGLSPKAQYCKNMALMKVGSKVKIPQRQFIGESKTLMQQLDEWLGATIETEIKKGI